jgi:subtilisin family serine protease
MITHKLLTGVLVAVLLLAACHRDETTAPRSPAAGIIGVPQLIQATGTDVVVFDTTNLVPLGFPETVSRLGGVLRFLSERAGVAVVGGLSPDAATLLAQLPGVSSVTPDRRLNWLPPGELGAATTPLAVSPRPDSIPFWSLQWGLQRIQVDQAWARGVTGVPAVKVAILDTGIDYDHQDLRGRVLLDLSRSFVTDPVEPGDSAFMDYHFHGSHVAGIVAAQTFRIAGVAPNVNLVAVKILNFQGQGTFENMMAGVDYAASIGADVINLSVGALLSTSDPQVRDLDRAVTRVMRAAEQQGSLVVAAAGNDAANLNDRTVIEVPCEEATLCVTATGPLLQQNFDQPAWYTNFGASVIDLAAPGGNFDPNNSANFQQEDLVISVCSRKTLLLQLAQCRDTSQVWYVDAAGTSMAAPHVSGTAALYDSQFMGTKTPAELARQLLTTSDDLGPVGTDDFYGSGRVNANRATAF